MSKPLNLTPRRKVWGFIGPFQHPLGWGRVQGHAEARKNKAESKIKRSTSNLFAVVQGRSLLRFVGFSGWRVGAELVLCSES